MNTLEGLKTFRFDNEEMNSEYTEFASALELLTEGKESLALKNLKHLYKHTQDPSLLSSRAHLLFALYFARSDWNQLELLDLLEEQSIEKSNRIIAKTLSQYEQTVFHSQKFVILTYIIKSHGLPYNQSQNKWTGCMLMVRYRSLTYMSSY